MKILHVVGARPNYMKVAPVMHAMAQYPEKYQQVLVHTGQHYDAAMSKVFFDDLDLPQPDINLEVGSGTHAWQTAQVMLRFEPVIQDFEPDWVFVVGDVNSTLACSLVASKLDVRIAHVEAGLRSFDRTMPEEINRLLTDQISDVLLTPSEDGTQNLRKEGIRSEKIFLVGNVMIDTLVRLLPKSRQRWPSLKELFDLDRFVLVTLHRPSNVDDPTTLREIMSALAEISRERQVIFPAHPRTRQRLVDYDLLERAPALNLIDPLGYLDFLALEANADLVLTDSGGVQEETTYLGVPCLTARRNTERPITISHGTNQLVESSCSALVAAMRSRLEERRDVSRIPPLWDGKTAFRILEGFDQYVVTNLNG